MTPVVAVSLVEALHDCLRGRWLSSTQEFHRASGPLAWACAVVGLATGAAGAAAALWIAASPSTAGEAWRIVFVHVPAAWLSLALYVILAGVSAITLLGRMRLAPMLASAIVPTGALMSLLAIWTGALWGRPTSGAWWVWDPRLAAELGLLITYLACLALPWIIDDIRRAERVTAMVALAGIANVAIVHSSAHWWQAVPADAVEMSLHAPAATPATVAGMALMTLAFAAWSGAAVLQRARVIVLEHESRAPWAQAVSETL